MGPTSLAPKAHSVNSRRVLVALSALAALAAPLAVVVDGADARSEPAPVQIHGFDGLLYDSAPFVVPGRDGQLFLGPDFDVACGVGDRYDRALRTLGKVAKLIAKSGRRVVFTAAPNKSSVLARELDPAQLPHGTCDSEGLAAQTRILQSFDDPLYLPLIKPLRASRHQVYWKTDPHWSSVGGSVFAQALAARLDKRLGRQQRYTYGTETALGMLNAYQGIDTPEVLETAFPKTIVRSHTGKGCDHWAGYPTLIFETCWNAGPAGRTWPGRTLLMGDSFMMYALQSMRPLFRHGRFMWLGHSDSDMAKAVKESDTVVIEVAQLFVPGTIIATKSFRTQLRRTLF